MTILFPFGTPNSLMVALLRSGMIGRGGGVEIVVADVGLHFDEVNGVEVAVAGASVVVAGVALDGLAWS
ncbi:MAG: hypothetical protein ACYCOX_06420 [Acidobacteriaceae bacterium]